MPRREILSPAQGEELLVVPVDRAGLIEHYVLSEQDISLIRQRRGDRNRLGIAATSRYSAFLEHVFGMAVPALFAPGPIELSS
jgi:hypothetical protein